MMALIDEIASAHREFIVSRVLAYAEPETRLTRLFEAGFAFIIENLAPARVMINNIYGPDEEFKQIMYTAYQPLFQFVSEEILLKGMAEDVFREVDPIETATLLMTIYLGTGSQVSEVGVPWLDPLQVAAFARNALRKY